MDVTFQITEYLQSGGCGDLYRGYRIDNGDSVVIKYLRDAHLPQARNNFERELRVLQTNTPGLMPVIAADLTANPPFYVMPYLQGSLEAYAGKLTSAQLRAIVAHAATVLGRLHDRSIAHGDIKPDNIIVSRDGTLRVADPIGNGAGCTLRFWEHAGGTPGYCAPEIRNGMPIYPAGDVYSLGATLYELSTGCRPQDGQDMEPDPDADPIIADIITACCNPDPGSRPTMKDLLRILEGERWAVILSERQEGQKLAVIGLVAAAFLFTFIFTGSTKRK